MRAEVHANDLRAAVKTASLAVRKSHAPITECLRISAVDNRLTVRGACAEVTTLGKADAAVADAGFALVGCAQFTALLGPLSGVIVLRSDESFLEVSASGGQFRLATHGGDFAPIAKSVSEVEVEGGVEAFLSCASFSEDLAGEGATVLFDRGLVMGRSISLAKVERCSAAIQAQLSAKDARIFKSIGGRLFISDTRWRLEAEGKAATGLLLPRAAIPGPVAMPQGDLICELDADDLFAAMDSLARAGAAEITLEGEDGTASVNVSRSTSAHITGGLSVRCNGSLPFICVNPRPMAQMLKDMKGSTAQLFEVGRATVWRAAGSSSAFFLGQMRHVRNAEALAA